MSEANGPWPTVPLESLASEMCLGKMLDKYKNRGTLQPYLRNVNVRWLSFDLGDMKEMRFEPSEETRFGLEPGDLVICEGGEPGRAAVWKGQAANARIQKALHRVRFRADEYDPQFAAYFLFFGTTTNRFAKHYTGTTIKHLTGKALRQVEFPVPALAEQQRIVAKIEELFSDLNAGVAALERAKANLKRYRAAVLKAAVEGKLTAAWRAARSARVSDPAETADRRSPAPSETSGQPGGSVGRPATAQFESAADLLQRILHDRRQKWEQQQLAKYAEKDKESPKDWRAKYKPPAAPDTTNLPKLPAGWCWATVEQLIERSEYGTSVKCNYEASGAPVLRIPNIAGGKIELADMKFATKECDLDEDSRLNVGDLLMCRTNGSIRLIGKSALVRTELDPAHAFASYLLRFRFVVRDVLPQWVDLFVSSLPGRYFIESNAASSAGQHNISLSLMHRMAVPLPPLDEQQAIVATSEEKESLIDACESFIDSNLKRAARLRQSILKRAFEGKLVRQDPTDEPASKLLERIRAGSRSRKK